MPCGGKCLYLQRQSVQAGGAKQFSSPLQDPPSSLLVPPFLRWVRKGGKGSEEQREMSQQVDFSPGGGGNGIGLSPALAPSLHFPHPPPSGQPKLILLAWVSARFAEEATLLPPSQERGREIGNLTYPSRCISYILIIRGREGRAQSSFLVCLSADSRIRGWNVT